MILYIMRHGETDWNKEWKLQGRTDIPLNENGIEVARRTKESLKDIKFDVAFTSPLQRARKTAELVLEGREIDIIDEERIVEISFGIYEGTTPSKTDKNRQAFFDCPEEYKAPQGGEEIAEMFAREKEFVDELFQNEEYKDSTILISTHGAALSGLLSVLKGWPVEKMWQNGLHKNCGMTIAEVIDGKVNILKEAVVLYS